VSDLLLGSRRVWRLFIVCALAAVSFAATGPVQTASAAPSIHSIITSCTTAAGFGSLDVTAMKKIADYESHDHASSHSRSCWGLFQLSTSMVKGHPWSDPTWNTRRALRYIKSRYGTPRKAWAHIQKAGWY
jgi:hypothetical protein